VRIDIAVVIGDYVTALPTEFAQSIQFFKSVAAA